MITDSSLIGLFLGTAGVALAIYLGVIVYLRMAGIRAITEMEAFDYTTTVALGSIVGGVAARATALPQGLVAVGALLGAQALLGWIRLKWRPVEDALDNDPQVLVVDGEIQHDTLHSARVTEKDLRSQLRQRGVWWLDEVKLAVLETNGALSVVTTDMERPDDWSLGDLKVKTTT